MIVKLFTIAALALTLTAAANGQTPAPVGSWTVCTLDDTPVGSITFSGPPSSNSWTANLGGSGHNGTYTRTSDTTWDWVETEPNQTLNGTIIWYNGTYYFYVEDSDSYGKLV